MIKKSWLLSLALAFCAVATASAQTKMVVTETAGAGREYATADIHKITFADNMMLVNLAKSVDKIELAGIKTITFGDGPTGIGKATGRTGSLSVRYAGGVLYASGLNGTGNVSLYTVDGRKLIDVKGWDGSRLDLSTLGKGVYILKAGDTTFKFTKD